MTAPLIFVTTEYDPVIPGGAGAVVANLADAASRDHTVVVILVTDAEVAVDDPRIVVAPVVDPRTDGPPQLSASMAARNALLEVLEDHPGAVVEFQDFDGLAFWTLTHRAGTALEGATIGIRYHLPADHILDAIGADEDVMAPVRTMEREALGCADFVISQTESMVATIAERYGVPLARIAVGPPPVPVVPSLEWAPSRSPRFAVIGRLSEQKGVHDLVAELGPVLVDNMEMSIDFIGSDGWSPTAGSSMRDWLLTLAPPEAVDRLRFLGAVPRPDLPAVLEGAWAVIVPSRLESFCLVAHEVRQMGIPLIMRDQPSIAENFDASHGALLYQGSDRDGRSADPERGDSLAAIVERVLEDPSSLAPLASSSIPVLEDPVAVYDRLARPRHPQSQAGLATAALYRFEDRPPTEPRAGFRAIGSATLRWLPDPLARVAVRVLPAGVKDRFRETASWPAEQERRRYAERLAAMRSGIEAGRYAPVSDPAVSVVIPCYNHGSFLEAALLSVFDQTEASWEAIIVDDGSTDPDTVAFIRDIDLPRVSVIRQENAGLPAARNAGIAASSGRFVVPLDADDELLPTYMERLRAELEGDPSVGFAHCWAELFGDVNWIWATRPYNPYTELLSNSVLQTAMMRRSAWDEVGGYDESMRGGNEDWDMWLRFQEAGWGNRQVREPLYRYRKAGITMSVTNEARFEEGRERIRARHPALYGHESLVALKRTSYPLVSIIVTGTGSDLGDLLATTSLSDIEVVGGEAAIVDASSGTYQTVRVTAPEPCALAIAAHGKYLVAVDDDVESLAHVARAVRRMEADSSIGVVRDLSHPQVLRRWLAIDRSAPWDEDMSAPFRECQDSDWYVPEVMMVGDRELPVVRQVPEERGTVPAEWAADRPSDETSADGATDG
jgi:GT2 family glycosyltransferase/glycosyltransferase involved in cell wall biosynthesis